MKRLLLLSVLMLIMSSAFAADYYWVGGTGNWTDLNHWASTSGGVANKSIVPGTGDDVYFDANSGLLNNSLVTLPTSGHAYCRNMSWNGVTTTATFRNTGSFQLQINGNLELATSVRYAIMALNFTGSSNATFRTNGAARINQAGYYNSFVVNKAGGSLTLLDEIKNELAVQNVTLTTGTLNLSGNNHAFVNVNAAGTTVRSLNISNANIAVGGTWDTRGSNMTLTATGSTVTTDMLHSTGLTFAKVTAMRNNPDMDINSNTFNELVLAAEAAPIGTQRIGVSNTINRLEFKGGGRIAGAGNVIGTIILAPGKGYIFHGNNTITTALQGNTPDCDALGELRGIDVNAKLTFNAGATADIRNVLISSLTVVGNIAPIAVVGEDGGSNVGFNITPRTGGNATLYWVGGGGDWNDKAHWSYTSGGTGGACVPFTTDNVVFDANSGFTAVDKTVTGTSTIRCHDMTWTNVANSPILDIGAYTMEIYGSIELDPTLTLASANTQYVRGTIQLKGTEASTFKSKGASLGNPLFNIDKTGANGGMTILDDLTFPACSLRVASGKLLMPGRIINIAEIRSQTTLVRSIDFSNATITVNDWANDWRNCTFVNNAAGSFITAKVYFVVNGLTYPKVHSDAIQNTVNISGNTSIGELVFTNTSPNTNVLALNGNNTVGTLDIRGGRVHIRGFNTITNLLLTPSRTYYFRGTQTITGLFRFNSPDCNGLGEMKDFEGTGATINFGPSVVKDIENVYVQNITATGAGLPISFSGADAGGNTGFNITAATGGPRYWVGGSGDWNDAAHWSNTSGGAGGACVPTVNSDVFFDANSFTASSKAVTILDGNAYCRNMDWTGATNAPTFVKNASFILEIWGSVVLNPAVNTNAAVTFMGPANATFTPNNASLGTFSMDIVKPGSKLTFLGDYNNINSLILLTSGSLDLNGRNITASMVYDNTSTQATNLDVRNATINARWHYMGVNKTLQADGSKITAGAFRSNGGVYNIVDVTTTASGSIAISGTTFTDLLFSNASTTSQAYIGGSNTIGRLEYRGRGSINGTSNNIETLIFAPGRVYTFLSGSTNTITKDWFGSGTPCNLTEISSSAAGTFTVNKTTGGVELDYVRLRNITAVGNAGNTQFKALEHSEDLGGNTNWSILPYNNTTPILGLGPDKTLCADAFPYTIKTDGFFASPMATFAWGDGSTGNNLVVAGPGTYTVTVSYPDGCSRTDNIVITRSDVVIAPITGTANACVGATTNLATTTTGGVWSSSNTAIATVSTTGVVTGVAAGTADIIYTVTNGNGCVGTVQQTVTINAMPTVATTAGLSSVFAGDHITLTNATTGGVWSSSNTAVATVDASGVVTGVAAGTANIIYTVTGTGGCAVASTHALTVDAFDPAKRVISITKTIDAAEPATHGAFAISLPTGVNAVENITVNYTVAGTATAGTDYTALTGTATILAGQNSVAVAVDVINDTQIESVETVIANLTTATSTNYTYTINSTANSATVQIADDDDVPANRLLSVTAQLNVNEPANTGTFTIALPTGVLAPEDITVTYTMSGTATNGDDYETLSGTATILAGQNSVVIDVKAIDDQIIEQTETIILMLTGGTSTTAGSFGVHATNGVATLLQADNDYTASTRLLAVASNGNAAEPGTHSSFTISLPTGYVSSLPITVTYALSGTATYGSDYSSNSATTVTLPAGQNSVNVPINIINDSVIEQTETVVLTITNGVATQGATTVFSFTPNPSAPNASMNIADDDNTNSNKQLSVTAQNGAEPATNGRFTISLPTGITSSENITLNYNVTGNATSAVDYKAITGPIVIPAGQNSVEVPLIIIDDKIIEGTENVTFNLTGASSTNFNFTASPSSATAQIADDDAAANTTVVLLTKVSDAVEGGTNGQYRISLPPGVTSAEDITISFNTAGTATSPFDYTLSGAIAGSNIIIPAGSNEVFVNVFALPDAVVEGPETVILNLVSANAGSTPYTIDPTGNGAVVTIIDANSSFATNLEVTTAVNGAEPATSGSLTISLAGGATSAYPITVGYSLSGTAIAGLDYQNFGTITIPANTNSIIIPVQILDDQIIEDTETMVFTILSGNALNAGVAYSFPPSAGLNTVTVNIADNDAAIGNRVLAVVKTADAAEPDQAGSFTISLPTGYTSSVNIPINYMMGGTATRNTDYTINTITLPANTNSVTVPVLVIDDQTIEDTETVTFSLATSTAANGFVYSANSAAASATLNIADDDNTVTNRTLSASATGNATEGGAAGGFSIKLPGSMLASAPITVNYTVGGTATSVADYAALTGTATIAAGQNSVAVTVTSVDDNVIEPTETVTLTITGGTSTLGAYTAATGSETATVDIIDNDANADAKKTLSIALVTHAAEPATNGAFRVQLPVNMSSSEDITVNYTVTGTATRNVDYKTLSGTVVIPAGQRDVLLPVEVIDDYYMEATKTVIVTLTDGASASFAFPITTAAQKAATMNILDEDNTPANRTITLSKTADAAEPGTNGNFRVSLPTNILCPVNITVNYASNGSTAVSGTDYQPLGAIVIPAGQNYVDVPVKVIDDKIIEPTETVRLTLNGTSTAGFGFGLTVSTTPVTVDITDDDDIPANRVVNVLAARDGEEGGASVRFNFTLPTGVIPSENITVNYTISGTAVKDVDYTPLNIGHFSGTATISTGSIGGTAIVANIVDDNIIEGTENVTITITSVTSPSFTYTFGGPATASIIDNDNLPANLVLAVAKTADAIEGATNGEFTISLPGTTTTAAEAITVNYTLTGTATNGTDYTGLSGSVVIPAGDHEVKIAVNALTDQIIEGTETVILTITGGNSTSFAFTPSTTNASATVNITDATNTPANRILSIAKLNDAAEPSTSGRVNIALPTGITATENISVSYTVGGTATAGTDYASLSGTATILAGQNNVIVPISVIDDQLIEQTETVTLTLTAGNSTNFVFTATGSVTVNIADDDNIPANLVLNVTKTADAAEPATHGNFNIALPTGITVPTNITVNYTVTGTATAGKDYATLSGTATILAGQNSVDVPLTVIDDQEVEGTETITLAVTSGTATGLTFTGGSNATIDLADDDNIPANLVLAIAKVSDAAEPATDGSFSISLPTGITVAEDITVNYTVAGTATAGTDYTALTGTVIIPAGQNSVTVPVTVIDDQIIEGTETVIATLTGATSANFTLSAAGNATVNIVDDENTVANKTLTIAKTVDAAEPATNGNFSISLPTGITAVENITVNYTVAGTATAGTDYTALTGTATILAGQNAVNIPVLVNDDKIVEGTETVIATLTGASSTNFSFTATGNATLNIADDDNTAANRVLAITKTADAAEPASNGNFNISLPTGITAKENITVNYTVAGTATAGTDYTPLTGTATILAGQNSVNVPLLVIDDNVYEPTETVTLTLTGGTSTSFSFTTSTTNGTATANITDNDKMDQVIIFTALPGKIVGDPNFTLTATGGASGNPVTFTSSNPAVATVSGNIVTIVGAGTVTITASQAGNAIYHAAADVPQVLTVIPPLNTAPTLAAIANQQICLTNAPQSIALSGISAGTETTQTTTLSVSASNPTLFSALSVTQLTGGNGVLNYTLRGAVGTATITVTVKDNGGTANGGVDVFTRTFTITASALPQVQLVAKPGTTVSKGETIEITASGATSYTWATAAGTIPGQTSATLTVRPAQTTTYTVTGTNAAGCTSTASITITVIEDFKVEGNNVLTPNGDGKNDFFVIKNIDMYPNNEVRIFDRAGRAVYTKRGYNNEWDGTVNGKALEENTYYYIIDLGKGVKPVRGYITIVRKY